MARSVPMPRRPMSRVAILCMLLAAVAFPAAQADAADVVELWAEVAPPAAPELADAPFNPAETALLVLDMEELTCNAERRPRCLDTVAPIAALLERARAAGMAVVHSRTSRATPYLPPVVPLEGEPSVKASVDKFLGTDLERIMTARGVRTVIVTGTAAHGAVLHTATGAAQRGLKVIVPVDCLSAEDLYTEQAAVWALLTGPGTRRAVTLTTSARLLAH